MKSRKAINFDLDTKKLRQFYPCPNYRQAYKDIKKFLENNGFKHRQFSGYISQTALSDTQIIKIVKSLQSKFLWFSKCARRFDVTDVGKEYDMMKYISNCNNVKIKDQCNEKNSPMANNSNEQKKISLLKKLDEKKTEADISEKSVNLAIKNKNDIEI